MKPVIAIVAATALLVQTATAAATIGPFAGNVAQPGVSATVGIVVPLGGRRGLAERRPRAELRLGGAAPVSPPLAPIPSLRAIDVRRADSVAPAPATLALRFGENTRWYAGGRPLGANQDETPEDDDGIDTLEGIGIGVGVLLGLGAAAVGILVLSLECDADEECN